MNSSRKLSTAQMISAFDQVLANIRLDTNDSFKLPPEVVAELLVLPENFRLGSAIDNGGCFFDCIAQSLNHIQNTNKHTEKSMRLACYEFYSKNKARVDDWNNADNYKGDYRYVQFTETELEAKRITLAPIWGRPSVEGRMLCEIFHLDQIYVIEIMETENENDCRVYMPFYSKCTIHGLIDLDKISIINYDENIPTLFGVQGEVHFDPILPNKNRLVNVSTLQCGVKSHTIFSNYDSDMNGKQKIHDNKSNRAERLIQLLSELNDAYLAEKDKEEYKPAPWQSYYFGWNNTLDWQAKAKELRQDAWQQFKQNLNNIENIDDKNRVINHALTLDIFKDHRSNYLRNIDSDETLAVTLLREMQESLQSHRKNRK